MSVVTGALGSLAPKLLQLIHGEYKLQKGVKQQVQWIHSELESIRAILQKVSDVPWDRLDKQLKVWVREVREASYDMEDVLDVYLVRVDGGEPADPSGLKRTMKKIGKVFTKAKPRHGIAGEIEAIKKHLEEISERRQRYKLDDISMSKLVPATSSIDPRLAAMYKQVSQLIGVDKSSNELISMLNPSQTYHAVSDKKMIKVSIVGDGGLGKTTLAKVVYDKLKSQYECGAFVSIGRDHDLVKVFKDILFHLDKKNHEEIHNTRRGVELLVDQLREFLEKKRYFIVIDDVWEVRTWRAIHVALFENNCGSTVITTTRKLDVAQEAGEVYKLKPLSREDSTKLFYTRIFDADKKYFDKQPNDVSNKILKKCAGIPLAIITMASLFAGKPECQWSEVYNSISFGSEGNQEVEDTMIIISFSYYDLPPHLRTCLLYLSTYPEDYEIKKDSLIWKWIAEGFIHGDHGTRLFDLGERYFNDLVNRSLIQAVEDWDGIVIGCRVHDMVLDLMRKIASEENFIAILGDNVEGTPAPSNTRRLTHQNRIAEHINSDAMVTGMPKVRSYTAFGCSIDSRDMFMRFKLLRVLDIVDCKFKEGCHLEHLGDLLHLRYLGITGCGRLKLPKEIGNLKLLQTLDVHGTLPTSFVHLTELVRLSAHKVPDGIGKLVSLEELLIIPWGSKDMPERFFKEIGSLQELRVLRLYIQKMDESMQRDFVESLSNLQKIKYIYVDGLDVEVDTAMWEAADFMLPRALCHLDWYPIWFSKFPSWINATYLPNMSYLDLSVITMDEQDMQLLARLRTLCFLGLGTRSTVTISNVNACDGCFFPKLRYFILSGGMVQFEQPNQEDASVSLHIWNGEDARPFASRKSNDSRKVIPSGVMPNLEVLDIQIPLRALKDNNGDCGNIGLEYLPSLREVRGWINCDGMTGAEIDAASAQLQNSCKLHPNNPTFGMQKINGEKMVSTHEKEDGKQREEEEVVASQTADTDLGPSSS